MHELSIMKRIVETVLSVQEQEPEGKITGLTLLVGEGRNFVQDWVQNYFDMLAKDTPIAGAEVKLETVPVTAKCADCGEIYQIHIHEKPEICCPKCKNEEYGICTGYEIILKNVEFEIENREEEADGH